MYYRVAIRSSEAADWIWKSQPTISLNSVLGVVTLYRAVPKHRVRVFLTTSPEHLERMLELANQGLPSTGLGVDQLWDKHHVSWTEVRRLEIELGSGGDRDQPYIRSMPVSSSQIVAWTALLSRRERGDLVS